MNRRAIALAVGVFAAGSALASDKSDIMAVLKQWNGPDMATFAASCANDAYLFPPNSRTALVVDTVPAFVVDRLRSTHIMSPLCVNWSRPV
jgi:hypothetical protein